MKVENYFLAVLLFLTTITFAQESKEISGVVLDENNIPLPGANIALKNSSTGTMTDFDGNFSIMATPEDILVFSFIGYKTAEYKVGNQTEFEIIMIEDADALDEVVVVGYGTQKKSVVTGAISSVNGDDLETLPINNVGQALQGRTSGVTIASGSGQPGSGSTIRIRGITSLNNNDPLWIVD